MYRRKDGPSLSASLWLLVAVLVILPRGALAQTVGHWRIDPITYNGQTTQSSDQPGYYSPVNWPRERKVYGYGRAAIDKMGGTAHISLVWCDENNVPLDSNADPKPPLTRRRPEGSALTSA